MEKIVPIRELRLKDLEIFKLKTEVTGNFKGFILILDCNRPSTLDDFPYLKGIEDEKEFGRSNYIKILCISEKEFDDDLKKEVEVISEQFIGKLDDCHWNIFFETESSNVLEDIQVSRESMLDFFEKIALKNNVTINLKQIPNNKFNYLSQD